ncbi:galactose oxidase [Laetiporus sulphureus 93-53]|uniref:Galactose oxidase n=1 Tax=Laetiporus sulphureus 93-53 TaxID=1314785 RepID=A0A165C671_9APHY|nr:galactose oxidase [Laetiporus sulphureus 93-53]KZT02273.1 galactose oxidase [Laetiporus sulphureus 93-53]
MSRSAVLRALTILALLHDCAAYTAIPRWGQAVALVENVLFVHGGRADQYNEYAYSSAPTNNDMLVLSLTTSFNLSAPPWSYISGCDNCSSPQDPSVAWHTMSPLNTTYMFLFGGELGSDSNAHPEAADSAVLVSIKDVSSPVWDNEATSWADEPLRRMYHSACATGGKVYIVGGLKSDGSGEAFSTHYVFNPSVPSFTALPSSNGPPAIYGHQCVVLSDGRMIVFGGYDYSSGALVAFDTIWALDTTDSTSSWSSVSVSSSTLPNSRRGFAATLVDGQKVVLQGGADADLTISYSDGWVLDTTQSPMVWSEVSALSEMGARRDHFAVALGSEVLFGFGYETNGPAPVALQYFDFSSSAWISSYTPAPAVTSPTTTTLSGDRPTYTYTGTTGTGSPSSGQTGSTSAGTSARPTFTASGSGSASGSSASSGGSGSGSSGSSSGSGSGSSSASGAGSSATGSIISSHKSSGIVLGTVIGVVGLIIGAIAAAWYVKRQRTQESFHVLSVTDEDHATDAHGDVPMAGSRAKGGLPVVQSVRSTLGLLVPGLMSDSQHARRDMLADEDTRHFDSPWHARDASAGQSSWSSHPRRPTWSSVMHESLASLRSVGGTVLAYAAVRSREPSGGSRSARSWWEKERMHEPYADDAALMGEGAGAAPRRPKGRRQASYATTRSSYSHYEDPLDEYEIEELPAPGAYEEPYDDADITERKVPSLNDPPPRPYSFMRATAGTVDLTRLSPVSERPSVPTLSSATVSSASHSTTTPFAPAPSSSTPNPSYSSLEMARSPRARRSSILDASPSPPAVPMRRSNSWWTRFAKTPLLDRHASDASRASRPLEIRDPNPPPRLIAIEESTGSNQAREGDAPVEGQKGPEDLSRREQPYSTTQHGRSASSLQTAKTANSDMIDKMGRTMDIVQRSTTSLHSSGHSADSEIDVDVHSPSLAHVVSHSSRGSAESQALESPEQISPLRTLASIASFPSPPASSKVSSPRRPSVGQVAARVQAYERRVSQDVQPERPPLSASPRKERASVYGVAPKPSLFVANPDHRTSRSSGSASTP